MTILVMFCFTLNIKINFKNKEKKKYYIKFIRIITVPSVLQLCAFKMHKCDYFSNSIPHTKWAF